jgi:tRNA U34 5-carboxymethylaminomethyl modifying enzyme MnmG/GidA
MRSADPGPRTAPGSSQALEAQDGFVIFHQVAGPIERFRFRPVYSGYIDRQKQRIAKNPAHQDTPLAADLDHVSVRCLSTEVVQKLSSFGP